MTTKKNTPKSETNKKQTTTPKKKAAVKKTSTIKKVTATQQTKGLAAKVSAPVFTLPTNHVIAKNEGSRMIIALEDAKKTNSFDIPLAVNFNKNIFESFLQLEHCEGIRIYFGLETETNLLTPIITGIDIDGNDIYLSSKSDANLYVGDMGQACPLYDASKIQLP